MESDSFLRKGKDRNVDMLYIKLFIFSVSVWFS